MTTLQITDGTTTINLFGERGARVEYELNQRAPQVGIPNRVGDVLQFLGRESIELTISGFTLADATWNTELALLASWAATGQAITFNFSMMPIPFTGVAGRITMVKPNVRIGEANFCQITARIVAI